MTTTDTVTVPDSIEGLAFDEIPKCECEYVYAVGPNETCANPATWYATCKGCADHGFYCDKCRGRVLTYWYVCDNCKSCDSNHWVRLD